MELQINMFTSHMNELRFARKEMIFESSIKAHSVMCLGMCVGVYIQISVYHDKKIQIASTSAQNVPNRGITS